MKILVLGLGVIGTTYGYLFSKQGHKVEHYIRPSSTNKAIEHLSVGLLDGRHNKKGDEIDDQYRIIHATEGTHYDLIIVSISSLKLADVIETINKMRFEGTLLLFCGIWEKRAYIDQIMNGHKYILGYPVAGGRIDRDKKRLECVVFDHVMLEKEANSHISNYTNIEHLFREIGIQTECPYDMLSWIWLHLAINAGVISTISSIMGTTNTDPKQAVTKFMDSPTNLKHAIKAIRECIRIAQARGIKLSDYRNETLPYRLPTWLSAWMMKRMFATNRLTRRIMQLHTNLPDLVYICNKVYKEGKKHNVSAPLFYTAFEKFNKQYK